jgi:hypothetical protein
MHEVRITVPRGRGPGIAQIGLKAGLDRVTLCTGHAYGPNRDVEIVSVEASTPAARAFLDAVASDGVLDLSDSIVTTRELRAILGTQPASEVTRPMVEPIPDVFDDLWQLSHITSSYVGRATAAALLMAHGMLKNDLVSIVVAALFLPFFSQVLALGFGAWVADWKLARHGGLALLVSTAISLAAGVAAALVFGGPMRFDGFKGPLLSAGLSLVIGMAAGLSSADDSGRRYLIGVAAAAQSSIFPIWFGMAIVLGFPPAAIVLERLGTLAINIVMICGAASAAYAFLGLGREDARRLLYSPGSGGRGRAPSAKAPTRTAGL